MSLTSQRRRSIWRKIAPRVVLLGISLLFSLAIGELAIRIVAPQRLVRAYYTSDAALGNVIRPNQQYVDEGQLYTYTVRTNEAGLRMDEPVDRSPGAARVLVLGDSFTFGWGVEIGDSFLARVGRRVSAAQLLNGGVGAYSSGHVYKSLMRRIETLEPCAAIYFMNSNDLADNLVTGIDYRVTSYTANPDGSIDLRDESVHSPLKRLLLSWTPYGWLNQHSHLFLLVKRLASGGAGDPSGERDANPAFGVGALAGDRADLALRVTLAHVDRIGALSAERRVPLLIVWIPAWTELFQPDDPVNATFDALKRALIERETPLFHDPLSRLREIVAADGAGMLDFYYRDGDPVGHFTARGNDLYARAVQERVVQFVQAGCRAGT